MLPSPPPRRRRRRRRSVLLGSFSLVAFVTFLRIYESAYSGGHDGTPAVVTATDSWWHLAEGRGLTVRLTNSTGGLDSGSPGVLNVSLQAPALPNSGRRGPLKSVPIPKVQKSASEALSQMIDLERCNVSRLGNSSVQANSTVVAAYYRLQSKHSLADYDGWIRKFMSIDDPVVVFTQPSMVENLLRMRSHAANRTVVVACEIDVLPIISLGQDFWRYQLDIDPEASMHKSYQVFWIWLSKTWWMVQAVHLNFFSSTFFLYSDIGSFRTDKFNNKTVVKYPNVVPVGTILWLAHSRPRPPPTPIWTNKSAGGHFYHSGSLGAGNGETWINFHTKFSAALDSFVAEESFVGEDQCVLQATCLQNPTLCAYVRFTQVDDSHYFGLRYVLHFGPDSARNSEDGSYNFWRPPGWNVTSIDG